MKWFSKNKQTVPRGTFAIVAPEFIPWSASDAAALRVFFSSPYGQKFYKICLNKCLSDAIKECAGDKAVPTAAGEDALLRFQQNLCSIELEQKLISQATGEQVANNTANSSKEAAFAET